MLMTNELVPLVFNAPEYYKEHGADSVAIGPVHAKRHVERFFGDAVRQSERFSRNDVLHVFPQMEGILAQFQPVAAVGFTHDVGYDGDDGAEYRKLGIGYGKGTHTWRVQLRAGGRLQTTMTDAPCVVDIAATALTGKNDKIWGSRSEVRLEFPMQPDQRGISYYEDEGISSALTTLGIGESPYQYNGMQVRTNVRLLDLKTSEDTGWIRRSAGFRNSVNDFTSYACEWAFTQPKNFRNRSVDKVLAKNAFTSGKRISVTFFDNEAFEHYTVDDEEFPKVAASLMAITPDMFINDMRAKRPMLVTSTELVPPFMLPLLKS